MVYWPSNASWPEIWNQRVTEAVCDGCPGVLALCAIKLGDSSDGRRQKDQRCFLSLSRNWFLIDYACILA